MNIHELDSYDLGDAVKFNNKLNPRIWGADEKMRPEVREQLLKIADDFREFLGIDVEVKDITVSGSNAAYTYTPHSDIDLHLVVDLPEADTNDVYRELFDAKKYAYNEQHDIRIGGYDVELYVQDARKPHHSQGIYSVKNDDWVSVPKRKKPDVDDISVKSKFEDLGHRIEAAIKSGNYEKINDLAGKIKDYRQAGLDAHGEFGPENLAFKILRTQGLIKKLYDARNAAKDQLLSLDERRKKKSKKKKVKYGFGGYWYPGTAYAGQDHPAGTEGGDGGGDGGGESIREDAGMTWDGVNPSTSMFTTETENNTDEEILQDFIDFCVKELKIEHLPRVKLRRDPQWPQVHKTFGRYNDETKTLEVAWGQRHIMDVLRTVAHELTHKHQHEREGERMGPDAGETGSAYENEANARAGILMRDYGRLHPEYFAVGQAKDLNEETEKVYNISGYKVVVKGEYFYVYKGDQLIYRSAAPRQYTYDQLVKQVERAISITGSTVKNPGAVMAKPKYGLDDAYKKLLQIITYRVERDIDISPATIKSEVSKIANDYKISEKDLRQKWANTKPGKYSNTPELFAPYSKFSKYFQYNSTWSDSELGKIRVAGKANQWIQNKTKEFMEKHGLSVNESASGYIPTKAQAKDPRYSMALTVDIKPGQVGKEANKLKLKTDRQGHPQIARANGLFENLYKEYKRYKADEDYSPDEPPGPEFKPTMPKGTLRVDVSDVYDWYKLGQHISRMKGLGQHDFGKGPPSTIISFGDEDTEHKFIGDLEATGLDVTDIDPADVKKRPGKTIKTDPTYNVDETLKEFAPSPGYGDDDWGSDVPRDLHHFANLWWNAADPDTQKYIEDQLATGGWKIRQVGEEMVELRHREGTRYRISSDEFDPDLRESAELDEVKMSPGALEKFATSDAAKGIRAGFEAELIFRDTQGEADEMDPEPDYDADERAYSIQQVIEFFQNDEYGYGLSDRGVRRLENDLDETYMNWYDEQMIQDFGNEAEDLVREVHLDEVPMGERILAVLTDGMELTDEQADQILRVGTDAPRFTKLADQDAYAEANPDYRTYLEASNDADAILDEEVETSIRKQDGYYDQALDNFRDNYSPDSDSFFSDVGLRWMSDIANEYNLDWPVWNMDARGNDGSRDWEDIGASLQEAVGMPVKVSSGYHSTTRREGTWIIEPDGSLDPDDKSEEAGLEIVSPPMPLLMTLEKLRAVTDWANDPNGGNAYTNSSTGLHMGVSLPVKGGDVDYVKLILFMGDKYVLQQFGREANSYTASALEKFKQNIKGKRSDPAGVVTLLKHGLTELAHRELQKGVGTSKYTSAHLQDGYIEFRSPGGDWLAKADEEIGILENTMMRFARAMAIAGDPSAERQEYAKKLYKLVTADNDQYADQLRLFSEFSAGTINKEQLKKQWADAVLQKEVPGSGKEEYEVFRRDRKDSPDGTVGTLFAKDYDSAYDLFLRQYGKDINELDVRLKQPWFDVFDAEGKQVATIRERDIDRAEEKARFEFDQAWTDAWRVYRRPDDTPEPKVSPRAQVAKRIATKPKTATQYNYEIVDRKTGRVVDQFYAEREPTADAIYNRWLELKNLPNDTEDYGYRKSEQAADNQRDSVDLQRRLGVRDVNIDVAQNFAPDYSAYERNSDRIDAIRAQAQQPRQNYELVLDDDPDRVIHFMRDATADEVRAWIQQQEREGMPPGLLRTRIVAEAIDPVSGAGAVPPRSVITKKSIKNQVEPVEPVIKKQAYHSAIGQAISQQDLENMTRQIQVARHLGDDINENNVVAMPGNLGPAKKIAQEWMTAFNDADSADRNQILAGLQRQLADLGWQITTTKKYGGILRHLETKRFIPLQRLTEESTNDQYKSQLRDLISILDKNLMRLAASKDPQLRDLYYKFKNQKRQAEKKLANLESPMSENFADGRVKGKSRPGRVKRAGASCKGSVTDLRARAKKYGGEKGKMYHWCANMKSGRKK